jgi:hypothetical protein
VSTNDSKRVKNKDDHNKDVGWAEWEVSLSYVVEAHPSHWDSAGDRGRDHDVATAGFQVGQSEVCRVHRAPEVEIL